MHSEHLSSVRHPAAPTWIALIRTHQFFDFFSSIQFISGSHDLQVLRYDYRLIFSRTLTVVLIMENEDQLPDSDFLSKKLSTPAIIILIILLTIPLVSGIFF